jgi:hypothetical protein
MCNAVIEQVEMATLPLRKTVRRNAAKLLQDRRLNRRKSLKGA